MKKQLLQSVAATVLATVCSVAAIDTPAMAAPPLPPVPFYNWTGFYFGPNAGYSWGRGATNYYDSGLADFGIPAPLVGSNQLNGAVIGFQGGYNWQINNSWVAGLETDLQWTSEKANKRFALPYNDGESGGTVSARLSSRIEWFGTVRGRLGFLINPTLLVYGTGGLAYGRVGASGIFADSECFSCNWGFSQSAIKFGWAGGAGIEGAFPNSKNWTWKLEYLHIDLGTLSGSGYNFDFEGPYVWSAKFTDDIFRVGVNYRIP
jgi:outer membrane immunogenic protein